MESGHFVPNIIMVIKSRTKRWTGQEARIEAIRNKTKNSQENQKTEIKVEG
jgi:hypothetical protein